MKMVAVKLIALFLCGMCSSAPALPYRPDISKLPLIGSDPSTWSPTTTERPYIIVGPGGIRRFTTENPQDYKIVGPGGIQHQPVFPHGILQKRSTDFDAIRDLPLIGSDPRTWSPTTTERPYVIIGPGSIRQQRSADANVNRQPLPLIGNDSYTWSPTAMQRPYEIIGPGGIRQRRSADANADRRRLPPIGSDRSTWSPTVTKRPYVHVGPGGIRHQRSADAIPSRFYGPGEIRRDYQIIGPGGIPWFRN